MPPDSSRHGTRPSLWLLPDEAPQLAPVLAQLAEAHGGPRFAPHLTLLGSIDGDRLLERSATLAVQLSPVALPTGAVLSSARWFRCLTLAVPPSAALLAARSAAEEGFGVSVRPWSPHISLLYGDLPAEARDRIAADLPPLPPAVRFSTLALVATVGPTESWRELGRWRL